LKSFTSSWSLPSHCATMTPVARSSSIVALGEIPPSLLFLYLPSACVLPGD
jgi:hypothetical protein